jgi:hypothetical protein
VSTIAYLLRLFHDLNVPAASLNVALHDAAKATDRLLKPHVGETLPLKNGAVVVESAG